MLPESFLVPCHVELSWSCLDPSRALPEFLAAWSSPKVFWSLQEASCNLLELSSSGALWSLFWSSSRVFLEPSGASPKQSLLELAGGFLEPGGAPLVELSCAFWSSSQNFLVPSGGLLWPPAALLDFVKAFWGSARVFWSLLEGSPSFPVPYGK